MKIYICHYNPDRSLREAREEETFIGGIFYICSKKDFLYTKNMLLFSGMIELQLQSKFYYYFMTHPASPTVKPLYIQCSKTLDKYVRELLFDIHSSYIYTYDDYINNKIYNYLISNIDKELDSKSFLKDIRNIWQLKNI